MLEKTYPTTCKLLQVLEHGTRSQALDNFAKRCMTLHVIIIFTLVLHFVREVISMPVRIHKV
jgi:hypothetical protein